MADVIYDFDSAWKKISHFQSQTTLQFVHFMVLFYDITHIVYN